MEKLGAGGMGEVYRAEHRVMNRMLAIKIIRRTLLNSPDGQDLASLVQYRGPLPLEQAVDCVVQAARGLEYAHQAGIVHRDVKPSNLRRPLRGIRKFRHEPGAQ